MVVLFCLTPDQIRENAWPIVVEILSKDLPAASLGLLSFTSDGQLPTGRPEDTRFFVDSLSARSSVSREKTISALKLFNQFRESAEYHEVRFIAIKLLNRSDLSGTFRFLEREVILESVLVDIFQVLEVRRPDVVVFEVTPHEFHHYLLMAAANFLGIKTLFFQPCPITHAMIPRSSLREIVSLEDSTVSRTPISGSLFETARTQLRKLLEQEDPRYIELQRNRDEMSRRPVQRLLALWRTAQWLFQDRFPDSVNFSGHRQESSIGKRLGKIYLTRSLQKSLSRRINLLGTHWSAPDEEFVVLALHYEPERTSLPEGLPIEFQGDAAAALRAHIAVDKLVVVKEHYSQQSTALRGFAGRSPDFYDLIESFPNTHFAPTATKLSDLVASAEAVFTLTGTIAIESVLRGTPAAYWGVPWWAGLPGTVCIEAPEDFSGLEHLEVPPVEEVIDFLIRRVGDQMIPGIASEKVRIAENKLGKLPDGFFRYEALGIVEAIRAVCAT